MQKIKIYYLAYLGRVVLISLFLLILNNSYASPVSQKELYFPSNLSSPMIKLSGGEYYYGPTDQEPNDFRTRRTSYIMYPFYLDEREVTAGEFLRFIRFQKYRDWQEEDLIKHGEWIAKDHNDKKLFYKIEDNWFFTHAGQDYMQMNEPQEQGYYLYCNLASGRDAHPMNCVNWYAARNFCLTVGKRLPTELEWAYAAASGNSSYKYPNGDVFDSKSFCSNHSLWYYNVSSENAPILSFISAGNPREIGACSTISDRLANLFGLYDMAGNVSEWTSTAFKQLPYFRLDERENQESAEERIIKGGSWLDLEDVLFDVNFRNTEDPDLWYGSLGFRCASTKKEEVEEKITLQNDTRFSYDILAQKYDEYIPESICKDRHPVYVTEKNKSGFINRTGKIMIDPSYDGVKLFYENRAQVKNNGNWGFINARGKVVIPLKYANVKRYAEGLAGVLVDGKWGFIDNLGKMMITPQFEDVLYFSQGMAVVKLNGKWGTIDHEGKFIINPVLDGLKSFTEGVAPALYNGKWGFMNENGVFIVQPSYENARIFSSGLAPASSNKKWSYVHQDGSLLSTITLTDADYQSFLEQYPTTKNILEPLAFKSNGNVTFASKDIYNLKLKLNEEAFSYLTFAEMPLEFDDATAFQNEIAMVKINGGWEYIDKNGFFITQPEFMLASQFWGTLTMSGKDENLQFIDQEKGISWFPEINTK